jgi:hypothetical protein
LGQFTKSYRTFYQKNFYFAVKNMGLGSGIRDPGSRIQDPEKPYTGSRGKKGTGSRIRNIAYLKKLLYLKSLFSVKDKKLRGCIGTFSEMQLHSGNQTSIISI